MADDPKPEPPDSSEPAKEVKPAEPKQHEESVSDFITRNVLEKETVFFEG